MAINYCFRFLLLLLLFIVVESPVSYAKTDISNAAPAVIDEAEKIYTKYGKSIYQIQVIDRISNKKTSIGSGFQISKDGYLATNYHVVSELIQNPKNNRLEYLTDSGERGALKVVLADVVHDLAVVAKLKPDDATWLELGQSELPKGARIFSLGNPHDIGFTIIEGTYNGVSKKSLYEKIHFSGSLNPGMSGGPALNHKGQVVGINVSTAGNQISFLVPVEHLKVLLKKSREMNGDFLSKADDIIGQQLKDNQERFLSDLLKKDWESMSFGPMNLLAGISDIFKCWGGAGHEEKDLYEHYYLVCSSEDNLYLESDFSTGRIRYNYDYLEAKDSLNIFRFYEVYESLYSIPNGEFYYNAREEHVTDFSCNTAFVDIAKKRWKSSFCVRQYKKYKGLYDLNLYMALVGEGKKGLLISLVAQGVDQKNALSLANKFLQKISPLSNSTKVVSVLDGIEGTSDEQ